MPQRCKGKGVKSWFWDRASSPALQVRLTPVKASLACKWDVVSKQWQQNDSCGLVSTTGNCLWARFYTGQLACLLATVYLWISTGEKNYLAPCFRGFCLGPFASGHFSGEAEHPGRSPVGLLVMQAGRLNSVWETHVKVVGDQQEHHKVVWPAHKYCGLPYPTPTSQAHMIVSTTINLFNTTSPFPC